MKQTLVKAGDELTFLGEQSAQSLKLTSNTNAFRYVPSDTIGATKCVATKTGILSA